MFDLNGLTGDQFQEVDPMTREIRPLYLGLLWVTWILSMVIRLDACPFCKAVGNSLLQEADEAQRVVIARCEADPGVAPEVGASVLESLDAKMPLQVLESLKGDLVKGVEIQAPWIDGAKPGQEYLCFGFGEGEEFVWAYTVELTNARKEYVSKLFALGNENPERFAFLYRYLEEEDRLISEDAYAEFARAPHRELVRSKLDVKAEQLKSLICDPECDPDKRRLYWTLLGIVGTATDAPLFTEMLPKHDPEQGFDVGLDAGIACYIRLAGEEGLATVEREFLENQACPSDHVFSAVQAIRFFCVESDQFSRERMTAVLKKVLERPELADLVIPDLARMQDWSAKERVAEIFISARDDNLFVRVPAANYLRACPEPEAIDLLERCRAVDPAAVRRATTVFPAKTEP